MPRVYSVKKARKDHGNGIKKGDSYYFWTFMHGPTMKSKTYPKPSQLTRSEYLSQGYGIQESLDRLFQTFDDIEGDVEQVKDELEQLRDETQEKYDNQPPGLQEGDTGQLLQERADLVDELISRIEDIEMEYDEDVEFTEEEKNDKLKEVKDEVYSILADFE